MARRTAPERPPLMQIDRPTFFRCFVCVVAAILGGVLWNSRPNMSPNDNARWDTIWSLVEYGTYQIFDSAEEAAKWDKRQQLGTIDKIQIDGKYYSSKPPLMPTVIAGFTKVQRSFGPPIVYDPKNADNDTRDRYFKPVLYVFQLAPWILFLVLYGRYLDRTATTDFGWLVGLLAAGLGTLVGGYVTTLNNHMIAAWSSGICILLLHGIWYDERREWWRFALTGLLSGWTFANELPAAALVLLAGLVAFWCDWKRAVLCFVPPLALVVGGMLYTTQLSSGSFIPAYGRKEVYDYPDSYWTDKNREKRSKIDALSLSDPKTGAYVEGPKLFGKVFASPMYFLHMTVGHHGIFSLTPIWLFALIGGLRTQQGASWRGLHWPVLLLSAAVFLFYCCIATERNYGGYCHGLRWLLWLTPLWLLLLPVGLDTVAKNAEGRILAFACLVVSIFSAADTLPNPWTYSWLHKFMLWCGLVGY